MRKITLTEWQVESLKVSLPKAIESLKMKKEMWTKYATEVQVDIEGLEAALKQLDSGDAVEMYPKEVPAKEADRPWEASDGFIDKSQVEKAMEPITPSQREKVELNDFVEKVFEPAMVKKPRNADDMIASHKFKRYEKIRDRIAAGEPIKAVCDEYKITRQTYGNWRRKFEGVESSTDVLIEKQNKPEWRKEIAAVAQDDKREKFNLMAARLAKGERLKAVCSDFGITDATYYNWKKKYGGEVVEEENQVVEPERGYDVALTASEQRSIIKLHNQGKDKLDISAELGIPFDKVCDVLQ